jgi:hypothetical protein
MPNELYPIPGQWYAHLIKGQQFFVSAIDEDAATVEIQHFDGDLEEATFEEWRQFDIELSVAPESWAGALDVGELDDLGTEVTDTRPADWVEPQLELRPPYRQRFGRDKQAPTDAYGEGYMEEEPLG